MRLLRYTAALLTAAGLVAPLSAQESGGWNAPDALDLVERAQARREQPRADSVLRNYRADAGGYVYFYLDRNASEERTLVRVDQIALEVYWGAPDRTKQRIVGLRDQSRLPNRMYYHLDHLTVVQNEFGNTIRIGDGDEVRDVPHPAAPGADSIYDFRVADSMTIRLPGAPEPVRVFEVEVKPERVDRPAFVGSIFVDRATADIVRMTFTFTPASYVDKRLDFIRISLDNGLWEGRYWLPHEQRVELRRQLPELDFVAGAVIKGVIKVSGYHFNEPLPEGFFAGPAVTALPERLRRSHDFDEGIYDGLAEEGLAPPPHMEALRRQAAELIGERNITGFPSVRLHVPNASSALRYNRAEGVFAGAGLSYTRPPSTRLTLDGGYAFGAGHATLTGAVRHEITPGTSIRLEGYADQPRDLGVRPALAGVWNTFASAFLGDDYLDLFYASGTRLGVSRQLSPLWSAGLDVARERHESADLAERDALFDDEAAFRPVQEVRDGTLTRARATLTRSGPRTGNAFWDAGLTLEAGTLAPATPDHVDDADGAEDAVQDLQYLRPVLSLEATRRSADRATDVSARLSAGAALGDPARQQLFFLGGLGTLPGYGFRSFAGDRFALAEVEASRAILGPWVRLRALAAAGWTAFESVPAPTLQALDARESDGVRTSAGLGLGLFWDVLRLDAVRGLNGGDWQVLLTVRPDLGDIL